MSHIVVTYMGQAGGWRLFSGEWSDSMSVDRSGYPGMYLFDLWIMVSSFGLSSSALL